MHSDYLIRPVTIEDLDAWWSLRLMALKDAPSAFGSDYATMRDRDPHPFYLDRGYLTGGPNMLFAAITGDGRVVAQAGTYVEDGKRSHIAHVISVFTHPGHRGQRLASQLVQSCIQHLQTFPEITSVRISVNASNAGALRIYESLGFVVWGEEPDAIRTADGSCHNELHMVLQTGAHRS